MGPIFLATSCRDYSKICAICHLCSLLLPRHAILLAMIVLFGIIFVFLTTLSPVSAASRFDFILQDTKLVVNFSPLVSTEPVVSQADESSPSPSPSPSASPPKFLQFEYRLSTDVSHDPDTVLLLLADGERVAYALPAATVSTNWQTLTLDLATLGLDATVLPVLYTNQVLEDAVVMVRNVAWLPDSPELQTAVQLSPPSMTELHAVQEADGRLTLLVSVADDRQPDKYHLHCIGADGQISQSLDLVEQANFFWSGWDIPWMHSNARSELIFQAIDFTCPAKVQVSSGVSFYPVVEIVDWQTYAAN